MTLHANSRPLTNFSHMIWLPALNAVSTALSKSSSVLTLLTPTLDPLHVGFTNNHSINSNFKKRAKGLFL